MGGEKGAVTWPTQDRHRKQALDSTHVCVCVWSIRTPR